MTLSPAISRNARCADPALRDLVDSAFERQGSPAQRRMEKEVCPTCPIWRECLADALATGEHGPWGGTNERRRRRDHPALREWDFAHNIAEVDAMAPRMPDRSQGVMESLGVTSRDVKEWAVRQGMIPAVVRGKVPESIVFAYAEAHA